MKPEFSKPFDLDAARAGATFGCRDGRPAEILKWDGRRPGEPLIGFQGDSDIPASWTVDGAYEAGCEGDIDLVMLPLGLIDGKPVFVGEAFLWHDGTPNVATAEMAGGDWGRCAWPAPEKVYPASTMRHDDMFSIYAADLHGRGYTSTGAETHGLAAVANAALRQAIDAGQVITSEQAGEEARGLAKVMADRRAERDIAIAEAVRKECLNVSANFNHGGMTTVEAFFKCRGRTSDMDLAAIIATIE